ncbi:histidine kinase [Streptomyces caniscabiei]|uniref:sensor histidine kinase n=2 Tax=Streptomyces caniscabiei TaxID=2746961 RepID=UPI0029B287F9|nr:histidine kinase [Streptomyces caniscabiei]MDX2601068.1 histidine kinase [Streptomyces caniscabiei]MDX2739116.1 histidine kinase [Streptomyces caniscabiei]
MNPPSPQSPPPGGPSCRWGDGGPPGRAKPRLRAGGRGRRPVTAEQRNPPPPGPGANPTTGYLADDATPPATLRLQLNALQALARQTFAVRLTMLTIGTPFAMANTTDNAPTHAVLVAAVLGVTVSYAMLRDWYRFAPRLLAHPTLMALDLLFGAVLLLTASPASPLAYATVCTPLLSGLLYGWRGAGVLTGLQLAVLLTVHRAWEHHPGAGASTLLVAGFCVAAGIIGVTLRNLMFRFGTATQALAEATSRLAVAEAVESERARLARDLHDSVAKTLHGLALAADALATSADRPTPDPAHLRQQAGLVASAARRAAAESRDLLTDLRRHTDLTTPAPPTDLTAELTARAADFANRTSIPTRVTHPGEAPPPLPPETTRHLLAITAEALENIHRHAHATTAEISLTTTPDTLHLTIKDDGVGLPPALTLEEAQSSGHFGLLGMAERAARTNATLHLRTTTPGTELTLTLPLPVSDPRLTPATSPTPRQEAAHA